MRSKHHRYATPWIVADPKKVALEVSEMRHVILLINASYLSSRYVLLEIVVEQSNKSTLMICRNKGGMSLNNVLDRYY